MCATFEEDPEAVGRLVVEEEMAAAGYLFKLDGMERVGEAELAPWDRTPETEDFLGLPDMGEDGRPLPNPDFNPLEDVAALGWVTVPAVSR